MPDSDKLELVYRRREIARMKYQGKPISEIAQKFGITERQVYYDLEIIKEDYKEQQNFDTGLMMVQTLEELELLKETYWEAWHKSKEPQKTNRKRIKKDVPKSNPNEATSKEATNQSVEVSEETKEKEGNAVYLKGIESCLNLRSELLGLKKTSINHEIYIPPAIEL